MDWNTKCSYLKGQQIDYAFKNLRIKVIEWNARNWPNIKL